MLFPCERPLQRRGQVLEEVKTVRDLNGVGSSLPRALRVGAASVAGNDLYSGMLLQPLRQGLSPAVGEQIDDAAALEIHQDRAILLALPLGPVVHPEYPRRAVCGGRRPFQSAQQRVAAGAHSQMVGETCAGFSAQRLGDGFQCLGEADRAPGVGLEHPWEPLGEDAAGAVRGVAVEAAGVELQAERNAAAGQVGRRAHIRAMNARGRLSTLRTARSALDRGEHQRNGAAFRRDGVETKEGGVGHKQRGTHTRMLRPPQPQRPAHHQKRARASKQEPSASAPAPRKQSL